MRMIPEFPVFRRLDIGDREVLEARTACFTGGSDFGFTSLWCWDTDETCALSTFRGNLIVRFRDYTREDHFYSFLGQHSVVEATEILLARSRADGLTARLRLISEKVVTADPRMTTRFTVLTDRDNHDYVYSATDWAQLAGTRFGKLRRLANRCQTASALTGRILDPRDAGCQEAILELFAHWVRRHPVQDEASHHDEQTALRRLFLLGRFEHLRAYGCFEGDRLAAFSIWEQHPASGEIVVHFQKTDRDIHGLAAWQVRQLGQLLRESEVAAINLEQDLGIPGLRAFKEGLQPVSFHRKYTIGERGSE